MVVSDPRELRPHPRQLVAEACGQYGATTIAQWCADLLDGSVAYDDSTKPSLTWLGGAHAEAEIRRGDMAERGQDYWARVWAARGLLYVWVPQAVPAIVDALSDPAWRVREMAAKVVRLREIGEAADALQDLVTDDVPRVRAAAVRALGAVGEGEHAEAVRDAFDDAQPSVRRAADLSLAELRRRLDRDL